MNRKRPSVSLVAVATIGALALAPAAHASQGPWHVPFMASAARR